MNYDYPEPSLLHAGITSLVCAAILEILLLLCMDYYGSSIVTPAIIGLISGLIVSNFRYISPTRVGARYPNYPKKFSPLEEQLKILIKREWNHWINITVVGVYILLIFISQMWLKVGVNINLAEQVAIILFFALQTISILNGLQWLKIYFTLKAKYTP